MIEQRRGTIKDGNIYVIPTECAADARRQLCSVPPGPRFGERTVEEDRYVNVARLASIRSRLGAEQVGVQHLFAVLQTRRDLFRECGHRPNVIADSGRDWQRANPRGRIYVQCPSLLVATLGAEGRLGREVDLAPGPSLART